MIKRLLIANRGEIARRIIRTCRTHGIETVAVYSDADVTLPHVREADFAVHLGPSPARESYLDIDKVIAAAQRTGADAIHPGYGFLSENTAFAAACAAAGIVFVGPPAKAIELMGDKAEARKLMAASGVPVLPGCDQDIRDDQRLLEEAQRIGYPLLIKAVAGGGGKGMRVVHAETGFIDALHAARREAKSAFGDDRVLLERYLSSARHIEVQVFADQHGNVVHLFERDCSVQRRHQKIIEEAPAPGLTDAQRTAVGEAAVQAARAIDYVGAGTVEFLFADGHFYFMEMNTRLQVEHPVTELITGEDLVLWQLQVAAGQRLPRQQTELHIHGAAMEVRIYAEDPWQNFMPSSGLLNTLHWPHQYARVDSGYEQGDRVESHYDPMIAKIICHADTRDGARRKLISALEHTLIDGIHHNVGFLVQVLGSAPFAAAHLDTRLLEQHPHLLDAPVHDPAFIALAATLQQLANRRASDDPWHALQGWRPLGVRQQQADWLIGDEMISVSIEQQGALLRAQVGDQGGTLHWQHTPDELRLSWNTTTLTAMTMSHPQGVVLNLAGNTITVQQATADRQQDAHGARHAPFSAPMSGTVVALHVTPGTHVKAGTAVVTMEAMKMEHTLRAPEDGIVDSFNAAVADQVAEGTLLANFRADELATASSQTPGEGPRHD
jgi:3-methylcrotonyl-CoA carboxylase alpha subunit